MILKPEQTFSEEHISTILKKRDKYASIFDKFIEEGVESGDFVVKEKKLARMIILGAMNWIQQWYSPDGKMSKEEISQIYSEYFLKMLT
ncbi:TetR family transcriptional regulator C-terminal domain-containing protein [Thalassobacillus sp. C254]|uniref:TetR family transcriptional regulator C-terminal domain-containing protein n=1 Tax=Thalassobacillus sp. C254 TaxID=1225341 RepID=UPI0022B6A4E4|nr:TetR family transcriptional regulator C-terminal domain-containing protein [Thalassobacillus sp. C254]